MKVEFTPIHEYELQEKWPVIRQDLLTVAKKSKVDYKPIDILRAIKNRTAYAALLNYGEKHLGSLILRPIPKEFSDDIWLHVWLLAMSETKINGSGDLLDDIWNFVLGQAKQIGAKKIQVISDRKGWSRRLAKYGFEVSQFRAYHREVKEDG